MIMGALFGKGVNMKDICFEPLKLDGAFIINHIYSQDNRGGSIKCFEKQLYARHGIVFELSETFVSVSRKNVIRGMHFQRNHPQAKLVSVLQGSVYDVIVDLRRESATFKQWVSVDLSSENHRALYIPRGFAHGFAALEEETIMLYQCDGEYDKESDTGIRFDDLDLGIKWPMESSMAICSERDLGLMSLREYLS